MPTVYCIIVNFHQEELTQRAVESVIASGWVETEVILIDNESDGSWAQTIYGDHPHVKLIINSTNLGFGAACNQGIELALSYGADFTFLLNNDAVIEHDCLFRLTEAASRSGLAAPKIYLPDGRLYAAGGFVELSRARARNRGIYQTDQGQYDQPEQMPFSSGCALMISRKALAHGVRFYEPYFLYYEDADFCLALARLGCQVTYVPQARAAHLESSSTPNERAWRIDYYVARNRLLFLWRNGTPSERIAGTIYLLSVTLVHCAVACARQNWRGARAPLLGLLDFFRGRFGPLVD